MKELPNMVWRVDKSPYFSNGEPKLLAEVESPPNIVTSKRFRGRSSSDYFLKAPSSAHGAVESLGPMLLTWCSSVEHCSFSYQQCCERRLRQASNTAAATILKDDASPFSICSSCHPVIKDAFRRFGDCPIFQREEGAMFQSLKTFVVAKGDRDLSCVEIVDQLTKNKHMLRHLCDQQCYLRGFAPQRDWLALRNLVQEHSTRSVDETLRDWTCCLALEDDRGAKEKYAFGQHDNETMMQPRKRLFKERPKRNPACTEYLLKKSGERFSNSMTVLRHLDSLKRPRDQKGECYFGFKDDMRQQRRLFTHRKFKGIKRSFPQTGIEDTSSPFGLMEELFVEDPWRLLICTIFLNRTQRKMIDRTLHLFLQRWPTSGEVLCYSEKEDSLDEMIRMISPLGLTHKRARGMVRFCREFVALTKAKSEEMPGLGPSVPYTLTRDEITSLFFCGDYAADAYQIFIQRDVLSPVISNDHALVAFVDWKRSQQV
ncbi:hypothetical protein IV203_026161 [Nitzschia inconspicua]|uniref:HhH-GPD domain-containing protein n=1 Tax=Nitzschia inconspicua TaxID=303405 RepID=A0A9K3PXA8_9STRA|nr:hypothetical protein IV203_026161 [Nitzschia inconspicua]